MAARDLFTRGALQPSAVDLIEPRAAARLGYAGFLLLVRAAGNHAVLDRYSRELPGASALEGEAEDSLWLRVQNFTPEFLSEYPEGAVVRASCLLTEMTAIIQSIGAPVVARAGSGVVYGYFGQWREAGKWIAEAAARGWKAVIEFAPDSAKNQLDLWPAPGSDVEVMARLKRLFDPRGLLNPGRLYGRI
jgi:FAD/FMN-containing dehydrogenase